MGCLCKWPWSQIAAQLWGPMMWHLNFYVLREEVSRLLLPGHLFFLLYLLIMCVGHMSESGLYFHVIRHGRKRLFTH